MPDLLQSQLALIELENKLMYQWQNAIAPLITVSQEISNQLTGSINTVAEQYMSALAPVLTDFSENCSRQIQTSINQIAKISLPVSISLDKMYRITSDADNEKPVTEADQNILKYTSQNLSLTVSLPPGKITNETLNEFYGAIVKLESQTYPKADRYQDDNCHEIHSHEQTSFHKNKIENIATGVTTSLIADLVKIIIVLLVTHGDKVYSFVIDVLEFISQHFSNR